MAVRHHQAVTLAVRCNPERHVARFKEGRVVRIEHGDGRVDRGGSVEEGQQINAVASALPRRYRLAEQPHAHDVAKEPYPPVDSGLVGEVRSTALGGEHRSLDLDADQPPRAT